jgi:hypothetical protein
MSSTCSTPPTICARAPRFDYLLRDGMSTQRLGMTLLKQEQVLDLLDRE